VRKNLTALFILTTNLATSQVVSGTSVIVNITKNKIVVAADSLANKADTGPDYNHCKIAAFGNQMIFTSVGNTAWFSSGKIIWDNVVLAQDAFRVDRDHPDSSTVIESWAHLVKDRWEIVDRGLAAADSIDGQLTAGAFVDRSLDLRVAVILFDVGRLDPILSGTGTSKDLNNCWPCGQREGRICAAGSHVDVAARFCSERKTATKIPTRTRLLYADEATKLAARIVELTIDQYETTAGDVGGPVDVATMTKTGIRWNARKENCPERQD
jgi:hypothetical protein